MAHRRLPAVDKGKGLQLEPYQAPRTARVKIPASDNSALLKKHTLTIIGKVTNPSVQKVWSLIPFFTEHWKTEVKPVGSDLGQGLFQFQFALESDLLAVLEQRPFHYAKWMIILERWQPTTSPDFPSLIPFWIKVQGIPVHLWTEATIRTIGENIGIYDTAEITSLVFRMKVHINGRLPLIKQTVVEFSEEEEVTATLVYEKLEKHCTVCGRLDHELRDCLELKAQKRAEAARQLAGKDPPPIQSSVNHHTGSDRETSNNRVSSRSQNIPPHYERRRDVTHDNTSHQTYKRSRDFLKDRLSGGYHREPPAYKRSRYEAPRDRGETLLSRGKANKRQMEYREVIRGNSPKSPPPPLKEIYTLRSRGRPVQEQRGNNKLWEKLKDGKDQALQGV